LIECVSFCHIALNVVDVLIGAVVSGWAIFLGTKDYAPTSMWLPMCIVGLFLVFAGMISCCGIHFKCASRDLLMTVSSCLAFPLCVCELSFAVIVYMVDLGTVQQYLSKHQQHLNMHPAMIAFVDGQEDKIAGSLMCVGVLEAARIYTAYALLRSSAADGHGEVEYSVLGVKSLFGAEDFDDTASPRRKPAGSPCLRDAANLLKWAMLAASTVGPGSVVVCSKAGSEFRFELLWCLVIASVIAFVLQEAAARVSIVSGMSLGEALHVHFGSTVNLRQVPLVSKALAFAVLLGNTAYVANSFCGGMAALYILRGEDTVVFRLIMCVILAAVTTGLILFGNVDNISQGLGVVALLMTLTFGVAAMQIGIDGPEFAQGITMIVMHEETNASTSSVLTTLTLARYDPASPGGRVVAHTGALSHRHDMHPVSMPSHVSTRIRFHRCYSWTRCRYNLYLSSSIAEENDVPSMRKGISFATLTSFLASVLIVVVGSALQEEVPGEYSVQALANVLQVTIGSRASGVFCTGLFSAGCSAALSAAFGCGLAIQSLLSGRAAQPPPTSAAMYSLNDAWATPTNAPGAPPRRVPKHWNAVGSGSFTISRDLSDDSVAENAAAAEVQAAQWRKGGARFSSVVVVVVAVGAGTAALGIDTIQVILACQVMNGIMLPCLSVCLLMCLNDDRVMGTANQSVLGNVMVTMAVAVTMYLAAVVLVPVVLEPMYPDDSQGPGTLVAAAWVTVACMVSYPCPWR
jgi:Mn2+/Fe2+ NRAMP family transporter